MANMIERDIFVLRDATCVAQPIEYVQGTNTVPILLHVRDFDIPENSETRVYVEWPSTKGEYDTASINGNDVLINVKDTMFSEVGKCWLQLCITNGENTLVTFSYPVIVKKNRVPGITEPSENHSDFLDEYLKSIENKMTVTSQQVEESKEAADKAAESAYSAKQSEEGALKSESNAAESASEAKVSEEKTLEYRDAASSNALSAEQSNQQAQQSAQASSASAEKSAQSEENALIYSESAKADAELVNSRIDSALESAEISEKAAESASVSSNIANEKAELSEQYAIMAESFTHGGTGARENEAVDNAQYYLEQAKQISQSMNGLIPMGTISFADLSLETNQVNKYMFNISDDFVTDDTFKEGAGHSFPAGTNVYRTNDGYWDCLAGSFQTPNGDTKDNTTSFVPASTRANIVSGEKHSIIFGKIAKFFADLKTVAFSGSYKDLSDKPSASDIEAVAIGGDVADNIVTYTEATTLEELVDGEKISTAFGKVKLAVKNVISIVKLLGDTDISEIDGETVTGILSTLNTNLANQSKQLDELNSDLGTHSSNTTVHVTSTERYTWNAKQSAITGGASTIATSNLTASRVLISNSSGKVAASSSITTTELGYLDGVTSNIQTQLNNKASSSHSHSYLPLSGGTMTGTLTNTASVVTQFLELNTTTPFIDFHYNSSSADYTSRIIAIENGVLEITSGNTYGLVISNKGGTLRPSNAGGLSLGTEGAPFYILRTQNSPVVLSVAKEKENIRPFTSALDEVDKTDVFNYNLTACLERDGEDIDHTGFVIGDGYNISPLLISHDGNSIDLYNSIGVTFAAVKELYEIVKEQQNKINELEI